jgi:hypothetical protein
MFQPIWLRKEGLADVLFAHDQDQVLCGEAPARVSAKLGSPVGIGRGTAVSSPRSVCSKASAVDRSVTGGPVPPGR